jgi:hypothetical protein
MNKRVPTVSSTLLTFVSIHAVYFTVLRLVADTCT